MNHPDIPDLQARLLLNAEVQLSNEEWPRPLLSHYEQHRCLPGIQQPELDQLTDICVAWFAYNSAELSAEERCLLYCFLAAMEPADFWSPYYGN